jgi:hypothetical protein
MENKIHIILQNSEETGLNIVCMVINMLWVKENGSFAGLLDA